MLIAHRSLGERKGQNGKRKTKPHLSLSPPETGASTPQGGGGG